MQEDAAAGASEHVTHGMAATRSWNHHLVWSGDNGNGRLLSGRKARLMAVDVSVCLAEPCKVNRERGGRARALRRLLRNRNDTGRRGIVFPEAFGSHTKYF